MQTSDRSLAAGLATLIILQLIMLGALYAGVPPHPPQSTPLFAMAPFLAAAIATAAAALIVGANSGATGRGLSLLAAIMALASFGPQKYFDPQFAAIWPAVIAAQIAVLSMLTKIATNLRRAVSG